MTDSDIRTPLTNRVIGDPELKRLLVVDDEETIRLAVTRLLRSRGYEVDAAESGVAALQYLSTGRYSLMLCDIRMPGMSGLDLVPRAHELDADLAVVMLTALNDAPTATESISLGAMEYLTKPVDLRDLLAAIDRVLARRDFAVEQRNVERLIRDEVSRRNADAERERLATFDATLEALANVVTRHEAVDRYLPGTSLRVAALAHAVAEVLDLPADAVRQLVIAAQLHDIGKIGLRDDVLNKPGALSPEEFDHVKEHVRVAVDILAPVPQIGAILESVRDHHEHWDGNGYPRGIMGSRISLGGRILCAADAFIALTSRRAYREPMTVDETVGYLASHAGGLLDPMVYDALATAVSERRVLGLTAD